MKFRNSKLLVLIALLTACVVSFAQMVSGDLTGTVFDPTGAAVPGAAVLVRNDATGVEINTKSGATGDYRVSNLPFGTYTITVTASGFGRAQLKGIRRRQHHPGLSK